MQTGTMNLPELTSELARIRTGKKIVFTNGCFDLLHPGHIRYLMAAKKLGDILVVGVNSDQSVKKLKGEQKPIMDEKERAELVASLKPVDYVVIFSETTPEKVISELRPDVHVKGGNYRLKELPERKVVESYGGKVVLVKEEEGYSSSGLIERIKRLDGS